MPIGAPLPGIVVEVMVKVGQRVKANDPLFRIDDRDRKAELKVRQAMLADANAALERLEAMPRPEELPATEARVKETQSEVRRVFRARLEGTSPASAK